MANWTFSNGLPTYNWQDALFDIIVNGEFQTIGDSLTSVTMTSGLNELIITSANDDIETDAVRSIIAGTGLTFELKVNGTTVFTINTFTNDRTYAEVQTAIDDGPTNPPALFALLAPEPLNITGSADPEVLFGGSDADTINAGAGDDTITGGGGADTINGEGGTDTLDFSDEGGSAGVDVNLGANSVTDTFGNIDSVSNVENAIGTDGDDGLTGDDAANHLDGGLGNDGFGGSAGNDTLVGGGGEGDYVFYGAIGQGINLNFETGVVTKNGSDGTDALNGIYSGHGTSFADTVTMNDGVGGYIFARGGNDTLLGGDENDNFIAGSGADSMDGGGGEDNADYGDDGFDDAGASTHGVIVNLSDDDVTFTIGDGSHTVLAGTAYDNWGNTDTLTNIERVNGSQFDDVLVGNDSQNELSGGDGNDLLIGNGVQDDEDDNYDGGDGNDTIIGGNGQDWMQGGRGDDHFDGGGGDGHNQVIYKNDEGITQGIVFDWTTGTATDGYSDNDTFTQWNIRSVHASQMGDLIIGNADDNQIVGYEGGDTFFAGGGEDNIRFDRDHEFGGNLGVKIVLGGVEDNEGDDEDILYDGTQFSAAGDYEVDALGEISGYAVDGFGDTDYFTSVERAEATNANDTIYGSNARNEIRGRGGNDIIFARGGNDDINGGLGNDEIWGGDGEDYIGGDGGDDTVHGGTGKDILGFYRWNGGNEFDGDGVDIQLNALGDGTGTATGNITRDGDNVVVDTEFDSIDVIEGTRGSDSLNAAAGFHTDGLGWDWRTFGDDRDPQGPFQWVGGAGDDFVSDASGAVVMAYGWEYGMEDERGHGVAINLSDADKVAVDFDHDGNAGDDTIASGFAIDTFGDTDALAGVVLFDLTHKDDFFWGRNQGGDTGVYVQGGDGNDFIGGGSSRDSLHGDNGDDTVYGGLGIDEVNGSQGNDLLYGDDGSNDTLDGGDNVHGEDGEDTIYGGAGRDNLGGGGDNDTINGGTGNDRLWGDWGDDKLYGEAGDDQIEGQDGQDLLDGGAGNDQLRGGDEDSGEGEGDTLVGGAGNDDIEGHDGNDTLYGDDTVGGGSAGVVGHDRLFGDNGNDTLHGGYGNDELEGGEGIDSLLGGAGNDWLHGGDQNDRVFGGSGGDNVHGGDQNDFVDGGDGNDNVYGDHGDDTLKGSAGTDNYYGFYGNDIYDLGSSLVGNLFDGDEDGDNAGTDSVLTSITRDLGRFGGVENATITVATNLVHLNGNDLNNVLTGGGGTNSLTGGDGNDTLLGAAGNDTLVGGNGNDSLDGGANNDSMIGGANNDTYVVDSASDVADETGGNGADLVKSSVTFSLANVAQAKGTIESLTLTAGNINGTGNASANTIVGSTGANSLSGGGGNDTISGGTGKDTLTGGANNDSFKFNVVGDSVVGANADRVTDFDDSGDDKIDLSAFAGTFTYKGLAAFTAGAQNQVRIVASGADVIVQIDTDNDVNAEMEIILVGTTTASITAASDFVL
jgi:Ca2+-binding RTX toxin-like protein